MNQKITIAINREYGSGGRTIGEMIAKELGIHYYDKELVKLAAEDSGINEALFNKALSPLLVTLAIIHLGKSLFLICLNDKHELSTDKNPIYSFINNCISEFDAVNTLRISL